MPEESKTLNLNTVFLAVLLALSGWTLQRVSTLSEQVSAMIERNSSYTRELIELRARVTATEVQAQANELAIVRLSPR